MNKQTKDYLALALDNISGKKAIMKLIETTSDYIGVYKIGLEQFIRFGPEIIADAGQYACKIFLDLKLHDIPNTVAKAILAASEYGIDYLTLHTFGGLDMMEAAVKAAKTAKKPLKLLGVTILTSISKENLNNEIRIAGSIADQVTHLAQLAVSAHLDGIVCSASDLTAVKQYLPHGFEVITPGIRPDGVSAHDQKRVATPKQAIENGSTLLVIGRAITGSDNPKQASMEIFKSIQTIL